MPNFNGDVHPIVLLKNEGVYGFVVETAADMALVQYSYEGVTFQEYLESDEYEIVAGILFSEVDEE